MKLVHGKIHIRCSRNILVGRKHFSNLTARLNHVYTNNYLDSRFNGIMLNHSINVCIIQSKFCNYSLTFRQTQTISWKCKYISFTNTIYMKQNSILVNYFAKLSAMPTHNKIWKLLKTKRIIVYFYTPHNTQFEYIC